MSIISDVTNYISTLSSYADVMIDTFSDSEKSICVRAEAGNAAEGRYFDGTRTGSFQFAIYCRTAEKQEAIEQLNIYIKSLDLNEFNLTDETNITCEPLTDPHYVNKLDNGVVVYTASFNLKYESRGTK